MWYVADEQNDHPMVSDYNRRQLDTCNTSRHTYPGLKNISVIVTIRLDFYIEDKFHSS